MPYSIFLFFYISIHFYTQQAAVHHMGVDKTSNPDYWDGNIPWISVKDFNGERRFVGKTEKTITQAGLENSSTKMLNKNDIIVSARGTVGELAIIPSDLPESNFNQAAVLIRPYMYKEVLVHYLFYYLSEMSEINSISTKGSAGQVNLSLTQSQNIRIALPPLNEQVRIVEEVRKWFTYVNAIDNNSCELEELIGNTKQNILRMAIQGKLVLLGHKEVNRTTNLLTFPIIVHVDSINLSILSYMRSTQNVLTLRELPCLTCHIQIIIFTERGFCKGSVYCANNPFSSPN